MGDMTAPRRDTNLRPNWLQTTIWFPYAGNTKKKNSQTFTKIAKNISTIPTFRLTIEESPKQFSTLHDKLDIFLRRHFRIGMRFLQI